MKKITFQSEPPSGFFNTLKKRVTTHFQENKISRYATWQAKVKATAFFGLFVSLYLCILFIDMHLALYFVSWFCLGMFIIFAAMSIIHDAAHGTFSSKKWKNQLLLRFANVVGGDGYMYKYKHTISHHPYTNIPGLDIDLEQSAVVRVTPYTRSRRNHKHQYDYMKLLYPFYILFWVLVRDFKYYRMNRIGLVDAHHAPIHWIILIFGKLFYVFYMLCLPIMISDVPFWLVFAGFILMQLGSGLVAMFALLSNHVVEDSVFILPDENGNISCSWGEHQLRTTDDYSPDSKIISFMFSGLNHHVAHHLFPKYCHVHYPIITKMLRETALQFGLRYRYNSISGGLRSHFRLLKKLSHQKAVA